ncbi:MAG: hypothetical protein F4X02_15520 [Chloroflexi bacterium]|nr:hypothetical protein [Chloroflexota bacterium]
MDLLAVFVLASLIGAFMLVRVILWTTNRAAGSAITRYFKASEHILETGEPPAEWLVPPLRRRIFSAAPPAVTQDEIMKRLDELFRFFEHCSFFENEWTREQLLAQLEAVRATWAKRDFA